jgi:hypothetical protein
MEGEFSLFFFSGQYSCSTKKRPHPNPLLVVASQRVRGGNRLQESPVIQQRMHISLV